MRFILLTMWIPSPPFYQLVSQLLQLRSKYDRVLEKVRDVETSAVNERELERYLRKLEERQMKMSREMSKMQKVSTPLMSSPILTFSLTIYLSNAPKRLLIAEICSTFPRQNVFCSKFCAGISGCFGWPLCCVPS